MKSLKKLKTGFISRQFSVAKLAIKTGRGLIFSPNSDLKDRLKNGFESHVNEIVSELGVMKGSLMKAGQMLSLYADSFLPPEAKKVLSKLQNQSSFLDWTQIEKQIPRDWKDKLEIKEIPMAAASLGQVHLAREKGQEEYFAMKIQYAGVKKAINNDVKALKWLMKSLNLLPKDIDFTEIFQEIKEMLHQETNYQTEAESTEIFKALVGESSAYQVPGVIKQFSNDTIISTSFIDGENVDSDKVKSLPQEDRNRLGRDLMRLLFLELYQWGIIQTDAHMGNYLVMVNENPPCWGLIDFGACKRPPEDFLKSYQELLKSCAILDRDLYFKKVDEMGYLSKTKESNRALMWEYAKLIATPFEGGDYDWGASTIPDEMLKFIPKLTTQISVGNPPRHALFVDKKIGGVFYMLKELKAVFNPREVINEFI